MVTALTLDHLQTHSAPDYPVIGFYTHTQYAWQAMLEACEAAEESIWLEEFIFDPDDIGSQFVECLSRKAKQGVKVRLLLDWWGCKELSMSKYARELKEAGVRVCYFRPPSTWLERG